MTPNRRLPWLVVLLLAIVTLVLVACGPRSTDDELQANDTSSAVGAPIPSEDSATPSPTAEDQGPSAIPTPTPDTSYRDLKIVTLLPPDAIPAILDPTFLDAEEAWEQYLADEPVLGVSINGEHKASSIPYLSSREIVNDEVGGVAIAVTW